MRRRTRILIHGGRSGGLETVEALLREIDAEGVEASSATELGDLLRGDGIDLALADAGWEVAHLDTLLRELHPRVGVPIVLVADPAELSEWGSSCLRRFHATLILKPAGHADLAQALREGLGLRVQHRDHQGLANRLIEAVTRLSRCRERGSSLRKVLQRAGGELRQLRRQAESESRRRLWLLSTISHHLRTPVHEVVLCCNLLEAAGGAQATSLADWEGLTDGLRDSVAWLRDLVDDLVDIARLDLGAMPNQLVPIPLGLPLGLPLDDLRRRASLKGLVFQTVHEPADAVIQVDPVKLSRIIGNLVSNAVKFTEAGEVRVRIAADPELGVVLSVADTGAGIPADQLSAIFDEFGQVDNPERSRFKGTGLGLALCRRLVLSLGGGLTVRSLPGVGSTFTVTIPCHVELPETPVETDAVP